MVEDTQNFLILELRKFFGGLSPYSDRYDNLIPSDLVYSESSPGVPDPSSIFIGDEESFDDRILPSIVLTGWSGSSIELGLGQNGIGWKKNPLVLAPDDAAFIAANPTYDPNTNDPDNPIHYLSESVGAREINISFGLRAKTTSQRARMSDLLFLAMANRQFIRGEIEKQEVYPMPPFIRDNGASEEFMASPSMNMIYKADYATTFWTQWNHRVLNTDLTVDNIVPTGTLG
jgi:hypothetical protein